jgi:tetratricopeptide (TPR) repeat protein
VAQGYFEQALAPQQESLALYRELGDRRGQAESLNEVGVVYQWQGRYEEALARQRESLAIRRELGDPRGEAETLRALGVTLRALGRPAEARAHWREAVAIFEQLQTRDGVQVRLLLTDLPANLPR